MAMTFIINCWTHTFLLFFLCVTYLFYCVKMCVSDGPSFVSRLITVQLAFINAFMILTKPAACTITFNVFFKGVLQWPKSKCGFK